MAEVVFDLAAWQRVRKALCPIKAMEMIQEVRK
jgi:hypothetical protein